MDAIAVDRLTNNLLDGTRSRSSIPDSCSHRRKYRELSHTDQQGVRNFYNAVLTADQHGAERSGIVDTVQLVFQLTLVIHKYYWQPIDELKVTDDAAVFDITPVVFWRIKIAVSAFDAGATTFLIFRQTMQTEEISSRVRFNTPLGIECVMQKNIPFGIQYTMVRFYSGTVF